MLSSAQRFGPALLGLGRRVAGIGVQGGESGCRVRAERGVGRVTGVDPHGPHGRLELGHVRPRHPDLQGPVRGQVTRQDDHGTAGHLERDRHRLEVGAHLRDLPGHDGRAGDRRRVDPDLHGIGEGHLPADGHVIAQLPELDGRRDQTGSGRLGVGRGIGR